MNEKQATPAASMIKKKDLIRVLKTALSTGGFTMRERRNYTEGERKRRNHNKLVEQFWFRCTNCDESQLRSPHVQNCVGCNQKTLKLANKPEHLK